MAGSEKPMPHVPVLIGLDACCAAAATAAATAVALGASPQQAARAVFIAMRALPQAGLQGGDHFDISSDDQCSTTDHSTPTDRSATDENFPVDYFPDEIRSPSAAELDDARREFMEQAGAVPIAADNLITQMVAAEHGQLVPQAVQADSDSTLSVPCAPQKPADPEAVVSKQPCRHGITTHSVLAAEQLAPKKFTAKLSEDEALVSQKHAVNNRSADVG